MSESSGHFGIKWSNGQYICQGDNIIMKKYKPSKLTQTAFLIIASFILFSSCGTLYNDFIDPGFSGIKLSESSITVTMGTTAQLTATEYPVSAANQALIWTSTNGSVATVTNAGIVTPVAAGTANILVETFDLKKSAICRVTVINNIVPANISLNKISTSILVGGTEQLTATVLPANANDKSVTWASGNNAIATISSTGLVTAVALGTTNVSATTNVGGLGSACTVTVTNSAVSVTGITLDYTTASIQHTQTKQLTATITPTGATDQNVNWTSSNNGIASVSATGLVTANATSGTVIITATSVDGGFTATCTVTAGPLLVTSIFLDYATISKQYNQSQQLTATINPAGATNQTLSWSSDNPAIASVNGTGLVTITTMSGSGSAIITVSSSDGPSATCTVNAMPVAVTGVTITTANGYSIPLSGTVLITYHVNPTNATNQNVSWSSSDTTVATIDGSGIVTASNLNDGYPVITVTTADGSFSDSITIEVYP